MGSARFGQVADAVSGGLDLFIGREVEKERENVRQQWDLTLENLRAKRQGEAEDRQIAREDARDAKATERYLAGQETQRLESAATAAYQTASLEAGETRSIREDVRRREETFNEILRDIEKRRADALENVDTYAANKDDLIKAIDERFNGEAYKEIQSHVARMADKGLPGYEAETESDIKALLVQNRMPAGEAKKAAKHIYKALTGEPLIPDETDKPKWVADGIVNATGQTVDQSTGEVSPLILEGDPLAEQAAAASKPGPDAVGPGAPMTTAQRREAAGSSQYGLDPNYDWSQGFGSSPFFNKDVRAENRAKSEEFLRRQREGR